ncbi:MAG: hypothetical protein AB1705_14155 [Verrucomicrobiota bacterium]
MNRRRYSACGLATAACVAVLLLWRHYADTRYSVKLSDGSGLRIVGVSYGLTNEFVAGDFLDRQFGRKAPAGGINILSFKIHQPATHRVEGFDRPGLAIFLELTDADEKTHPLLKSRRADSARLEFPGEHGAVGYMPIVFHKQGRSHYAMAMVTVFSRDQARIPVRLQTRQTNATQPWANLAEFKIRNPARAVSEAWSAQDLPQSQTIGDITLTLLEAGHTNFPAVENPARPNVASTAVFDVTVGGQHDTNWNVREVVAQSADGNHVSLWRNSQQALRLFSRYGSLPTNQFWRVEATVAKSAGFTASELHTFSVPYPLDPKWTTNFAGQSVTIGYANGDMLAVELPDKPPTKRVTFVHALNQKGDRIDEITGSWGQHRFWRSLRVTSKDTDVTATIAIHDEYRFEFFVQPGTARVGSP